MELRKISIYMIVAVLVIFIVSICLIEIKSVGLNVVLDVSFALPLWSFAQSFLPLKKNQAPYIKISIGISLLAIVFFFLILGGLDLNFGESI